MDNRQPPQDLDAERALLGSMEMSAGVIDEVVAIVRDELLVGPPEGRSTRAGRRAHLNPGLHSRSPPQEIEPTSYYTFAGAQRFRPSGSGGLTGRRRRVLR